MNELKNLFANKKVLIFGLGLQGGGLADALFLNNIASSVKVTDNKPKDKLEESLSKLPSDIKLTLGRHEKSDIDWADIIIKNPAVKNDNEYISYAKSKNKEIYLSAALFVKYTKTKTIAVTGTRGKSTTANFIFKLLNAKWPGKIALGGNIPNKSPLQFLSNEEQINYTVLELSSFQLAGFHDLMISPSIAVMTNIYEDHLNYYSSMKKYVYDKSAIMLYQKSDDLLIINALSDPLLTLSKQSKAKVLKFNVDSLPSNINPVITGNHNLENFAAAYKLSNYLEIDDEIFIKEVNSFKGIPFRQELVRELRGVKFINDTTSTSPVATIKAIEAMSEPTNLIIGGESKNLPIDNLIEKLKDPVIKNIIVLGSLNNKDFTDRLDELSKNIYMVTNMKDAVSKAMALSSPGDVVLLSPGFASFDLFENEFDRGNKFNQEVMAI